MDHPWPTCLQAEEALASAIAEFAAQGVDLSSVITSLTGGDISAHPAAAAVKAAETHLSAGDVQAAVASLAPVNAAVDVASSPDDATQLGVVLHKAGAVSVMLGCLAAAAALPEAARVQVAALQSLRRLLPLSPDHRAVFRQTGGVAALASLLQAAGTSAELCAAALEAAAASGGKDEEGKAALVSAKMGPLALAALEAHGTASPEVVCAVCAVVRTLTNPDDESVPTSRWVPSREQWVRIFVACTGATKGRLMPFGRPCSAPTAQHTILGCCVIHISNVLTPFLDLACSAFPNARLLATQGAASALVAALRRHAAQPRDVTIATCSALRQVAANEDICREAAAAGAGSLALDLHQQVLATGDLVLMRYVLTLLRQLASSDVVKAELVMGGAIEAVSSALSCVEAREAVGALVGGAVAEQALGLLCNLTLRSPETSRKVVESGCSDEVLATLRALLAAAKPNGGAGGAAAGGGRTAWAARQACMALRNIGVRCLDVRPVLLEKGAEAAVRAARAAWPEECDDVGSAALRDLGLNNYND